MSIDHLSSFELFINICFSYKAIIFKITFNTAYNNFSTFHLSFSLVVLPCGSAGKECTCNVGDLVLIPGLGRSPGEVKGYPFQYSGLENSMDCIVHGVTKYIYFLFFNFKYSLSLALVL